ncbi:PqqD family peptide modification chaperone [Actinomycetota bacterium Odt1-20B]
MSRSRSHSHSHGRNQSFGIHPDVVWTADDGEVRLYDPAADQFHALNDTAAAVWLLLAAGRDTDALVGELVLRYGADDPARRRKVADDVEAFLDDLTARGLLVAAACEESADA